MASQGDDAYVRCRCRKGEGRAPFQVPSAPEFSAPILGAAAASQATQRSQRDVTGVPSWPRRGRQFGESLFRSIFTGEVGRLFERSRGGMKEPKQGLRLRIHIDQDLGAGIRDLPWELLSCPDTRDQFGLNRLLPVVRFLEVPRAADLILKQPPIRVLLAASSPSGAPDLNLVQEMKLVTKALRREGAVVRVIKNATLNAVRETLRRENFQVFHFMGHGSFDSATGAGSILLNTETGGCKWVAGDVLSRHLQDCELQVAILNACESGRSGGGNAFGGVASALIQGGLPAVVAMREPIEDNAAIIFSRTFYRELAAGEPIEAAVSEGRLAIYCSDPSSTNWAIPALYQRISQEWSVRLPAHCDAGVGIGEYTDFDEWSRRVSGSSPGTAPKRAEITMSGHIFVAKPVSEQEKMAKQSKSRTRGRSKDL